MEKINPPELEQEIGLLCYKSRTDGIGGKIKQLPEDFIVEEITEDGAVLEAVGYGDVPEVAVEIPCSSGENPPAGEFLHFTLQKNNWDTMRAMKEISKRLGVSRNRLSFAGTKDKRAVTVQRASAWNIKEEDLEKVNIKDIQLREFSYSND
ncbi:MAG: tRNA pseudouridine(13) synthase TruD, partial [Candidatus Altiarchaeota archaeon]|nr:tRNA pseudouridine(13) synthase TruD [Candidatus Altiarchaeota archaeon]